jgi:hypothetical protein
MVKIEHLTDEQEARLPVFRQEWLSLGLSTETIDRERSREAVERLYVTAGLKKPVVMFFDSPAQCILALSLFKTDNLGENLRDNLRDNLWNNFAENLRVNLRENLRESLWAETWFWGGQDAPWLAFYEFGQEIGVKYSKADMLYGAERHEPKGSDTELYRAFTRSFERHLVSLTGNPDGEAW